MTDKELLTKVRAVVREYATKQGHEKCHYHPDLFDKLVTLLDIYVPKADVLTREEFIAGCNRYQKELYPIEGLPH